MKSFMLVRFKIGVYTEIGIFDEAAAHEYQDLYNRVDNDHSVRSIINQIFQRHYIA